MLPLVTNARDLFILQLGISPVMNPSLLFNETFYHSFLEHTSVIPNKTSKYKVSYMLISFACVTLYWIQPEIKINWYKMEKIR